MKTKQNHRTKQTIPAHRESETNIIQKLNTKISHHGL